jgi:N-methylhydantoinase A
MLALGRLAGGVSLDIDAARSALMPLGEQLGLDLTSVAKGVLTIVSANMANAIREVTIEQGEDPRDAALIVFGGAGPMFGTLLARELEISRIVVPTHAGNFSAWGLLAQDVAQTVAQTSISTLDDGGLATASSVLESLFSRLDEGTSDAVGGRPRREAGLDMRFVGQEYTLTVPADIEATRLTADLDGLRATFIREYERTFGHSMDEAVEIVSVRATLRTPLPRRAEKPPPVSENGRAPAASSLEAYSFTLGEHAEFAVFERGSLEAGSRLAGPAIVLEPTATTYVDAQFSLEVNQTGTLFIDDGRT